MMFVMIILRVNFIKKESIWLVQKIHKKKNSPKNWPKNTHDCSRFDVSPKLSIKKLVYFNFSEINHGRQKSAKTGRRRKSVQCNRALSRPKIHNRIDTNSYSNKPSQSHPTQPRPQQTKSTTTQHLQLAMFGVSNSLQQPTRRTTAKLEQTIQFGELELGNESIGDSA